jgi:hypothetical protein
VNPTEFSEKLFEETTREFEFIDSNKHHFVDFFEEVALITRPPVSIDNDRKIVMDNLKGFIVSIFRVMPGQDGEKFERHWLQWTGQFIYYMYSIYIQGPFGKSVCVQFLQVAH